MTLKLKKSIVWIAALAVMLAAVFVLLPKGAGAEEVTVGNIYTVIGGKNGDDYSLEDDGFYIYSNTSLEIKNKYPKTLSNVPIIVSSSNGANITLSGVNIDTVSDDTHKYSAFKITNDVRGKVTITLADGATNTLISDTGYAGLQKSNSADYELEITGTGTLNATGGKNCAGIGGGEAGIGSYITISGGNITATGGENGAGIGGGALGAGSNITISGGTVIANGGKNGAGIGGGVSKSGSNITISGGAVTATGGENAAGIGGGAGSSGYESNGTNITISGGTVTATGGSYATDIGGGKNGKSSDIKITGGSVKATNGKVSATDNRGNAVYPLTIENTSSGTVTIDGKDYTPVNHGAAGSTDTVLYAYVTPESHVVRVGSTAKVYTWDGQNSEFAAGVELGSAFDVSADEKLVYGEDYTYPQTTGVLTVLSNKAVTIANTNSSATTDTIVVASENGANITLSGINIGVSSTSGACAFNISDTVQGKVTITLKDGSENTLKSGAYCAGLQKSNGADYNLEIKGGTLGTGTLTATGGNLGAGIGGYMDSNPDSDGVGSNITISGGTVTAKGGNYGAGIGGCNGEGSNITISGGTVTAQGGQYGAGIGGGYDEGSNITISGGTVTATGGDQGAGIGGGAGGSGSNITISGGAVIAKGGNWSAGIGGGSSSSYDYPGDGKYITISGGTVTATGGNGGASDIGSSNIGTSSNIKITGGSVKAANNVIAKDNDGNYVYLLTIENTSSETVTIDGEEYTPVNHTAVDSSDKNLYAYLTGEKHTVTVGRNTAVYTLYNKQFVEIGKDLEITADSGTLTYGTDYTYAKNSGDAFYTLDIKTANPVTISMAGGVTSTADVIKTSVHNAQLTFDGVKLSDGGSSSVAMLTVDNGADITMKAGTTNTIQTGDIGDKQRAIECNTGGIRINGTGKFTVTTSSFSATPKIIFHSTDTGMLTINNKNVYLYRCIITANSETVPFAIPCKVACIDAEYAAAYSDNTGSVQLYPYQITNDNGYAVSVDGEEYIAAGEITGTTMLWLTGDKHTVKIGDTTTKLLFDNVNKRLFVPDIDITATSGGELNFGKDYTYTNGVLTIKTSKAVTIKNTDITKATTDKIVVANTTSANITLAGVNIDVSATENACAFSIYDSVSGKVKITLADGTENSFKSGKNCAGLQKYGTEAEFEITGGTAGTGILNAAGGDGGAGIGGGKYGAGSNITISGGTINATSDSGGAGIGGGAYGMGSSITIKGNAKVTATAGVKSGQGAGIGGGTSSAGGSDITISGNATVTATGGDNSAGIGGASQSNGTNITIKDNAVVIAKGGNQAAGIGGGYMGNGSDITISDNAVVTATGKGGGAGIGGGKDKSSGSDSIKISGGSVKAEGSSSYYNKTAPAIGDGATNSADGTAIIPTNGTDSVYLLEIDNADGLAITINGKAYPTAHGTEKKIYAYLPAKSADSPNTVKIGDTTTKYYYKTDDSTWYAVVDVPKADTTQFTYTGEEQTYNIPDSTLYTISGNKQTNAGTYTITVALNDSNSAWSDGTTDPKTYEFKIEKASVAVPEKDMTKFTYTGEKQTYNIAESTLYTISGNKQTNAGTYTVTVTLKDKTNSAWSDGTTDPETYDFVIAKAKPTIPEPKLTYSKLYYGEKELACEIQNGWTLPNDNALLTSIGANNIDVTLLVDGDNYDYTTGLPTGYTFDETHNTLTATITINVKKAKPEIKIDTDVKTAKSSDTITVTASAVNPYNNSMTPTVTTYVKVGDGAETELTGTTYTVPENLADKTKITFIARVEGSAEYEAASAETFVVIGDGSCTHDNANTGTWYSDDTYHWQICPDCGAQVNKGEHNSTGTKATCTTGAECSECGKTHGAIDRANHTLDCKKVDSEYHITYCKDCGYEDSSSKTAHTFGADNKCIYCGYKKNSSSGSGSGSSSGGSHSGGGYSGGSTATTSYPSINGSTMTWTAVNNALKTSENGSEATINLNGASTVPTSVLKTIAEKKLKVTFVYSDTKKWFVDGADIEDTAKISDWSVALTPESKLSTDGIRGVEGLKFTIAEPQFPTDLTLTFNQKYSGQFANIYKLVDEKLVFIGCRKIAEDGTATLENIKGGTYAVTICEYSDLSGDMNNDGKLTAADASAALKYVVNLISDGNILMADLDGNGKITARDALIALRKVVGLD